MENIKEIDLVITVILGTLVMFLMVVVIVWAVIKYQQRVLQQQEVLRENEKKYQISLLEANINATEKEREAVSKNIHDDVGTILNVIKLNQSRVKKNIDDKELIIEIIATNNQLLNDIIENVRAISNNLTSPTLSKFGFEEALKMLCRQINESKEIIVELNSTETLKRLESKTELNLFRTCKEVLNNILKHSGANKVIINLVHEQKSLTILFQYNGKGISDEDVVKLVENNKGLGLQSIISRIQMLRASINYSVKNSNDSEIVIKLPIVNG